MAELLLELFSEEIPARMQAQAADNLARLMGEALSALAPSAVRSFHGTRRITWIAEIAAEVPASTINERGPKLGAPEQALAGFLRKHGAARTDIREEGGYFLLEKAIPGRPAAELIAEAMPALLRRFPWPKSMRWGGTSQFTWVRPLRRILCLLDGQVVPFNLALGEDDGHGLTSSDQTEGHRFLSPGAITIAGAADYLDRLRDAHVLADAAERRRVVAEGIEKRASEAGYSIVPDEGLLDEVAGLVEWPVALLGRIDDDFMGLPPEVRQVSMRVNQRYFALTDAAGAPAPAFVFAANIVAPDQGEAIIHGNERVLRARLSDARHFWDLDRAQPLAARLPALEKVTFHAKLGSQSARVARLKALAPIIAQAIGADMVEAERAAELAKADLTTGMVGEFPELQGVMGGYYALHDGETAAVAAAIREHYQPKGPGDAVPTAPVSIAVALAEKIEILVGFFGIGEKPTGSGDPYALRRAALGIIRIIRENALRLSLRQLIDKAQIFFAGVIEENAGLADEVLAFIIERLRVQLRTEGRRHDVLAAAFAAANDDDLTRLLHRTDAIEALLGTKDGENLLAGYRRAANILRIEEKKGAVGSAAIDTALLTEPAEIALASALDRVEGQVTKALGEENFSLAMTQLSELRPVVDEFFDKVTVNADEPGLRTNRLTLLKRLRSLTDLSADFSRLETTGAV
ncbi:glycine--tRNA ligase subunit beta [Acidisoma cellulosilytica]|uniref:Glycine--tRNA ligase beta subunit n=1 Tax=Acidisoma cellulosilyticum TaxID=2802395 RepID=A0A964E326_9PROT|nr:glycine--tRNA ligase subunit beta [Acidisoma cellulosilyticum]MCB8879408.1 glycine--tRNA ligase subunit beta [Acidisoma cellulosilyticum]